MHSAVSAAHKVSDVHWAFAMIGRLSILFTIGCLVTTTCLAGDAEDALGLLADALKCPNPVQKNTYDTPKHFVDTNLSQIVSFDYEINISASTNTLLKIENLIENNTSELSNTKNAIRRTKSSISASFGQLSETSIGTEHFGGTRFYRDVWVIVIHCSRAAGRCIGDRQTQVWCDQNGENCGDNPQPSDSTSAEVTLEVCDQETAKNAKFAIDTLVNLNRPSTSVKEEATPDALAGYAMRDNRDADVAQDLETLREVDLPNCAARCSRNDQCKGFSYNKWDHFCFLKPEMTSLRLNPKSISGIPKGASMPSGIDDQARMVAYRNKSFPGDGYTKIDNTDLRTCTVSCEKSQSCVAYTFFKDSNACRLFKSTEVYSVTPRADSGIKTQSK